MATSSSSNTKTPPTLKARPEAEDFAHKYTDEGQGKIGRMLINNYFAKVAELVASSGIDQIKNAKAIEIGCGEGFSTQRLNKMMPDNVTLEASEFVGHMIPNARKLNPGMQITEESVYELQHDDNEFEMVFLLEVLEHLDFPQTALEELRRVTKKDGYLILGVPREPLWCMLNMARGYRLKHWGNTEGHLNHWSTHGIKKYVRKHFGPLVEVKTPLPWTLLIAKKQ